MNTRGNLIVELRGYWHAGAGRSSGHHLDALCERDHDGLPVLPGKQLKGLLRHGVRLAESWGWLVHHPLPVGPATSHQDLLFGSMTQQIDRQETQPGILLFESARLPEADRRVIAGVAPELKDSLFGELFSTAINEDGSALAQSLRGTEVAIPCTLHAPLETAVTALEPALREQQESYIKAGSGWQILEICLPLLDHVGAHRSRGLGEARLELERSCNGKGEN